MFGLSLTEIIVIAILALVVFGPERIPGIARTVGKTVRDMRKAASDVQRAFEVEEIRRELKAKNASTSPTQPAARATLPSSTPNSAASTPTSPASSTQANTGTSTAAAVTAGATASASASAPPSPLASALPQLRAPIQSVPALDTFSALRSAITDAPDPLETLSDDEDTIADAEDAALSARLRAYLAPTTPTAASVAVPAVIIASGTLTACPLPARGTPKLLTIFRVVVKNAQPVPACATLTAVQIPSRVSVVTSAPGSMA